MTLKNKKNKKMTLKELKEEASITIENLKNHGKFPKENNLYDYKLELNFFGLTENVEIFMRNFAKDILAFSNGNGGIILLGIKEDKTNGNLEDLGLDVKNLDLLHIIDLNLVTQKFEKIAKVGVSIDLQPFQSGTRKFFYLLIEKQNQVLIPVNDFVDYKLKKGEIIYRTSSKNETANNTTQDFNQFLQIKANEKNKEFMAIWSKLLPEMFEINPREILIINPKNNKVYGFNSKDNVLSSSDIEIEKPEEKGVFNIILNAISAGEIGKITTDEGKPLYKIIGEVKTNVPRLSISMATLTSEIKRISSYKITNLQLKSLIYYLKWVSTEDFKIANPPNDDVLNREYKKYIWIEKIDEIKDTNKIVFSKEAIDPIMEIVNNKTLHKAIFKKELILNS